MWKPFTRTLFWSLGIFLVINCNRDDDANSEDLNPAVNPTIPSHFPSPVYGFENNPLTKKGIALGKKLFYDPILSADGTVSCHSCHDQAFAFADRGVAFSTGINGKKGNRNTPGLANLIWYPAFNWDGGINHIEIQPVAPLTDSNEMGHNLKSLLKTLQNHPEYPGLFKAAFGSDSIYDQKLLFALTQFMATMVSHQSLYDRYLRGESSFTDKQLRGKNLFDNHCATCHSGVLQTDFSYRQNGLRANSEDLGRMTITNVFSDKGKFRVPSLRNVEKTAPYMHDGEIAQLTDVIEAYSTGIQAVFNLDPALPSGGFRFSATEKEDLLEFLRALTDTNFLENEAFQP
ncbi:MAG: c-type cytochrome [Cryomorphaceae bacterium]|nr:c-type cytochrome [Cryomorphaceae bacterium]